MWRQQRLRRAEAAASALGSTTRRRSRLAALVALIAGIAAGVFVAAQFTKVAQPAALPAQIAVPVNPDHATEVTVRLFLSGCGEPAAFYLALPVRGIEPTDRRVVISANSDSPDGVRRVESIVLWDSAFPPFAARRVGSRTPARPSARARLPEATGAVRLVEVEGQVPVTSHRDATSCWVHVPDVALTGSDIRARYQANHDIISEGLDGFLSVDGALNANANRRITYPCQDPGGSDEGSRAAVSAQSSCAETFVLRKSGMLAENRDLILFALAAVIGALVSLCLEALLPRGWFR
jgi:hypothetical protein